MTTGELTKKTLEILASRGFKAWRQNDAKRPRGRAFIGQKGLADIIGFSTYTGTFLACEVKNEGDVMSKEQKEFLLSVQAGKAFSFVAVPENYGVALLWIDEYLATK